MSKLVLLEVCPCKDTSFGPKTGFETQNGPLIGPQLTVYDTKKG